MDASVVEVESFDRGRRQIAWQSREAHRRYEKSAQHPALTPVEAASTRDNFRVVVAI